MTQRRNPHLRQSLVQEVLPDYFKSQYPNLITFLESYYKFQDSDGGFVDELNRLYENRDIDSASLDKIEYLFSEIGGNLSRERFISPREVLKNIGGFFRTKGSLYSAQAFFRVLYGEDVEIQYPKDYLIKLNSSKIGPEGDRLQDGALWQVLSILVKTSNSFSDWGTLYKKFIHPAGFYLGSEILIVGEAELDLAAFGYADSDSQLEIYDPIYSDTATMSLGSPQYEMLGTYYDGLSDSDWTIYLERYISDYADQTVGAIDSDFNAIFHWAGPKDSILPKINGLPTISVTEFSE